MAGKINSYRTYGEKLISLFARLLFSGQSYSLTELSKMLHCSKQTVMRLVNDIRMAYGVDIEENMKGNKKYYRIVKQGKAAPVLPITMSELTALQMCKTFTEHLLGDPLYDEATRALDKTVPLVSGDGKSPSRHFASFCTGTIDYTPHQDKIRTLIDAMNAKKVCRITYQAVMQKKAKTYHVKPLKIFSYRDTVYLHARLAKEPGKAYSEPDFDPILAIHRFKKVEMTERAFEFPEDYKFDDAFDRNFGFMKDDCFDAMAEFTGWAADYVAERTWSPDQKITKIGDDKISMTLSVSSSVEFIAWILSFGGQAKVIEPEWLVEETVQTIKETASLYA
ncbi:MAG: WYL domain-containing protein [Deltaproteobacteria bacterium]|nr:WYL domain-containing protein [Deltaproteobacteria bacterium]